MVTCTKDSIPPSKNFVGYPEIKFVTLCIKTYIPTNSSGQNLDKKYFLNLIYNILILISNKILVPNLNTNWKYTRLLKT